MLLPNVAWADQWLGWRGVERQGSSPTPRDVLTWSPTEGIRWATAIPGSGHSSPVVFDNRVFVTTAYATEHSSIWKQAFAAASQGLVVLLALLVLHTMVQLCRTDARGLHCVWHLGTAWAYGLLIVVLSLLYYFGASALDYDRCIMRRWLGSSIIVSFCLLLAESQSRPESRWHLAGGLGAMCFAAYVVLAMPGRDHAFRSGPCTAPAAVVWATVFIPCLVGLSSFLNFGASRPALAAASASCRPPLNRRTVIAQCSLATIATLGATLLGLIIIGTRLDPSALRLPGDEEIGASMRTAMTGWITIVLLLGVCSLLMSLAAHLPTSALAVGSSRRLFMRRFAMVGGGVALGLTGGGLLLAVIIEDSGFLTYHLANPGWTHELGIRGVAVPLTACLLYAAIQLARLRPPRPMSVSARPVVRAVALAFAATTFISTNFTSTEALLVRAIVCLDRHDGRIAWVREGLPGVEGQLHRENTPATPTLVVGNGRIYAYFGAKGVLCTDLDGNLNWSNQQEELIHQSTYGASISPVFSDGVVVIVNPASDQTCICALDGATGALLWKAPLKGMAPNRVHNRTPIIVTLAGRRTLLCWDLEGLTAYALGTGVELWNCPIDVDHGDQVASPVYDDERIYLLDARMATALGWADLPTAKNVADALAWRSHINGPNCASPVLSEGRLYMVTDNGVATCLDARTGDTLWRHRLVGQHYASPVSAGKYVYFTSLDGVTTVVAAEPQYREVARAALGARMYASFAVLDDCLIARTLGDVICITGSSRATEVRAIPPRPDPASTSAE